MNLFYLYYMKDNDKLINTIIALAQDIKGMRQDMHKQLTKVNLLLAEHSRSIITLAEKFDGLSDDFNKYAQRNDERANKHETRIAHLEEKNFGSSYVSEPKAEYRKIKNRK